MAVNRGWWTLSLDGNEYCEISDYDLEHIAECIKDGCTSGEIVIDDNDDEDD